MRVLRLEVACPLVVGNARLTCCSVKWFVEVLGQRAFGVLWVLV